SDLLGECGFSVFKSDSFAPTEHKLVVTKSDPDRRIVYELNAVPAVTEFSKIVGIEPHSLSPLSFAAHPLVILVGGEHYCRSIQKVNSDNSLSFFCAIDDGVVLTVAQPVGMVSSTEKTFDDIRSEIGEIDVVLGFDCALRRVEAENRQVKHVISNIYRENKVIGFNTFGEQFQSMHLNQTLTGIAFGIVGGDESERNGFI
uniref:FIST C-terminal domain-containing protein n=1 Tax=Paracoccus sp. FO-3 TaxID=1335059 RepID=UPI0015E2E1AF